jgi:hypothetical protein
VTHERVADEEILFRRIPRGSQWFEPPDRISSFNFKLRPGEAGLSVYRQRVVTAEDVLGKPEAIPGSLVAWATAGAVRALTNAKGEQLHLDVLIVGDENNPGHAEIRGPEPRKLSASASKALQKVLQLVN